MYNRQKKAVELKAAELSEEMQRIIDRAQELIDATADEVDDKVKSAGLPSAAMNAVGAAVSARARSRSISSTRALARISSTGVLASTRSSSSSASRKRRV